MRRHPTSLAALTLVVLCGAALSGCSGDDDALPMSTSDVEDFVKSSWNEDADDSLQIDSVQCEDGLEKKLDDRTTCTLTMTDRDQAGGPIEVFVTETDEGDLVPSYVDGTPTEGMPPIVLFD